MNHISRRSFIPMVGTALVGISCLSVDTKGAIDPTIVRPKKLSKGDTIGICAPAGPIRNEKEVDDFVIMLKKKGFKVKEGPNIRKKYGFFSAPDEDRAIEFMDMILDESVDAIFFTRGGWGCARLLEHLDFDAIKSNPKIILGFSDITTLLNAISYKTGLVTFHGPGGNSSWNDYSLKTIEGLIQNGDAVYFESPDPTMLIDYPETIVSGMAKGKLFGGNLSVISGLVGSGFLPDWENKILFLEDVMEEPYRIDRMLTHLKLNGVFDKVNGIILGQFRGCNPEEPDRSFTLKEVFKQQFSDLSIPVFFGAPIGHILNKQTVPVGMTITMNADDFSMRLEQPAVIN